MWIHNKLNVKFTHNKWWALREFTESKIGQNENNRRDPKIESRIKHSKSNSKNKWGVWRKYKCEEGYCMRNDYTTFQRGEKKDKWTKQEKK